MALVDATTAKLHLRVDSTAEDALVAIWLTAAEDGVAQFLNRNVYADQAELDAAVAAAPATLSVAIDAYNAALIGASEEDDDEEAAAATRYAEETYARAVAASDMTRRGMVVNDAVKAAILLTVGHLYEHRGDGAEDLPRAAQSQLAPYRAAMGV